MYTNEIKDALAKDINETRTGIEAMEEALAHLQAKAHYRTPTARLEATLPCGARISVRKLSYCDYPELSIYMWVNGRSYIPAQFMLAEHNLQGRTWYEYVSERMAEIIKQREKTLAQLELLSCETSAQYLERANAAVSQLRKEKLETIDYVPQYIQKEFRELFNYQYR